jgi:signal transduction histidine kinase
MVAGIATGLAEDLKLDPILIRVAFAVLSLAQGAGVLLYLLLLAGSTEARDPARAEARSGIRQIAGIACVVLGLLLALRYLGFWFGDAIAWPLATIALGSTFVWLRADDSDRSRWNALASQVSEPRSTLFGTSNLIRLAIGLGLVVVGTAAMLREYSPVSLGKAIIPVSVTILGLLLALGPWLLRLTRQLGDERRERIRSEERSAMAAHLHDSVLQTLALIQRSGSPQEVSTLARQQERELRAWLYGKSSIQENASIRAALDAMAARMEKLHRVPIEAVIVGDCPVTQVGHALVQAAGEAMNNAGRHSHAPNISVYAEVEPDSIVAYVRDEGKGFDPSSVPEDRRGIADSITGRIARFGGTAEIVSELGTGTEVRIRVPRRSS